MSALLRLFTGILFFVGAFFIYFSFIHGRVIDLEHLKTNNVDCCEADLEIPISKFYDTM